jgi:hypothetical protein
MPAAVNKVLKLAPSKLPKIPKFQLEKLKLFNPRSYPPLPIRIRVKIRVIYPFIIIIDLIDLACGSRCRPHHAPRPLSSSLPILPSPIHTRKARRSKAWKLPRMHFFGTLSLEGYRTRSYEATKHDLATMFPACHPVHSRSESAQMPPEAS